MRSKSATELHPINGVMGPAVTVRAKSHNVGGLVRTIVGEPGHVVDFQKGSAIRTIERGKHATALAPAIGSKRRVEVYRSTTATVFLQANTNLRSGGDHVYASL